VDDSINIRQLVRQVYAPPRTHSGWRFEMLAGDSPVRYLRLGRHALFHGLKGLDVGPGDEVLMPAFICKELVAPVHALGAKPVYYAVNAQLGISQIGALPVAKAIVAVNFFGFPQDLAPFRQYCERTGAFLVEDNAHGLFGRDSEGRYLGTRGDVGIFSPRKSLDVLGGAALLVNNPLLVPRFDMATEVAAYPAPLSRKIKALVRASVQFAGIAPARLFIEISRLARRLRTGRAIPVSPPESEFELPTGDRAPDDLAVQFAQTDVAEEISRRRKLYQWLHESMTPLGVQAVFGELPDGVVPYGYPMRLDEDQVPIVKRWLANHGLECFTWPDLPAEVAPQAPAWYRQIWNVQFLW